MANPTQSDDYEDEGVPLTPEELAALPLSEGIVVTTGKGTFERDGKTIKHVEVEVAPGEVEVQDE